MSKTQKNKGAFFAAWLAAVVLALSLVLAGCPTNVEIERSRPITLSGQVYVWVSSEDSDGNTEEWVWDDDLGGYKPVQAPRSHMGEYRTFDGNRQVFARGWAATQVRVHVPGTGIVYVWELDLVNLEEEGYIEGGGLYFSIGTPETMGDIVGLFDGYDYSYDNFTISPSNARGIILRDLQTAGDGFSGWLSKSSLDEGASTSTLDEVYYIYVDRNVRITGQGRAIEIQGDDSTWTLETKGINISLRTGWNVMHVSQTTTITEIGGLVVGSETVMLSANDPEWARWKLFEIEDNISGTRMSPSIRRPGMPFRQFTTPGRQRFAPLPY